MRALNLRIALVVAIVVALATTGCIPALDGPADAPPPVCSAYASPTGDDGAPGTQAQPVFSPRALAMKLAPGQTGCFAAGSYQFTGECRGCIPNGGSPGSPTTLRPAPDAGGPVVLTGQWWIQPSASDLVIRDLVLKDSGVLRGNLMVISADRVTLRRNDISNDLGICVFAGDWDAYSHVDNGNTAEDLSIVGNRIHHCGLSEDLQHQVPSTSGFHGIYLSKVRRAVVADNIIYGNKWRGLQTWPDAVGVTVERNVFDGNGMNINIGSNLSEGYPWVSRDVVVRDNIITNATLFRPDKNTASVHGNIPNDGIDRGNRVSGNCMLQSTGALFSGHGYTASGNVVADPGYINAHLGLYRLPADSPCLGKGPVGIQPA